MRLFAAGLLACAAIAAAAQDTTGWRAGQDLAAAAAKTLGERAARYLAALVRIDTSNPPGNETRLAEYLKNVAESEGIACELLGGDASRMNFVARLEGSGRARPLLLMAHSDVVPARGAGWSVPPFAAELRQGFFYGRGTVDDKSLLAAELTVLVELKRANRPLGRDVILLSEADEEAGSGGIQWLIRNAWKNIDAEFALNEGGFAMDTASGTRIFQIETAEKVPMPVLLRARGTAGHGSLPREDNPVVRVARAIVSLADADVKVRLNTTTRRYLGELSRLPEYGWLAPLLRRLERPQTAVSAANELRERDPELDAQVRATVSPDVIRAGAVVNAIPGMAEAEVDVRRLPNETPEEVIARLRGIVHDSAVEIVPLPGHDMPPTRPSSLSTALYRRMEAVFRECFPKALVVPYMQRGATDGSFLRARGMAVYGVPLFVRDEGGDRAHGDNERMAAANLAAGTRLLWQIVTGVAGR